MRQMRLVIIGLVLSAACSVAGWAGDGVVALQTADPACPDDSGDFYVDCGNGTVTDNRSGLVWLKNADCAGFTDWFTARDFVAGLGDTGTGPAGYADCGLEDNSSPGEWRLPSAEELYEMFFGLGLSAPDCTPTLTNDAGDDCWSEGPSSFTGVMEAYWGSTPDTLDLTKVIFAYIGAPLGTVAVASTEKTGAFTHIWPVRGGQ